MFKLNFETENEVFTENKEMEIIGILANIMSLIGNGRTIGVISDSNGNSIGEWEIE